MKTSLAACSAALLFAACGCTSPQSVARSQSPHPGQPGVTPAGFENLATTQYPLHDAHAYSSSYHSTSGFPGYDASMNCPSGPCGYGGGCGVGCGHGCGHGCPHHYHSYAYTRPHNLVYPPPQSPAGAVVYPYYTHKGPSDFFRDDPKCNY